MNQRTFTAVALLLTVVALGGVTLAQPGRGKGGPGKGAQGKGMPGKGMPGKGQGGDAAFAADRDLIHTLLANRADIRREVKKLDRGVETLTESDKPEIAAAIQRHVASMEARVKNQDPIHLRDPLFAELFRHAGKIKFEYEKTQRGMHVRETSDDAYVVKLIQAHADVVSLFIKNGFEEAHRDHQPPPKP